jgi:hypothetical protein
MLGEFEGKIEYRIYDDFAECSHGVIESPRATIALPLSDIIAGKRRIELIGNFDLYELFFK